LLALLREALEELLFVAEFEFDSDAEPCEPLLDDACALLADWFELAPVAEGSVAE
jgi:hypothetical protein